MGRPKRADNGREVAARAQHKDHGLVEQAEQRPATRGLVKGEQVEAEPEEGYGEGEGGCFVRRGREVESGGESGDGVPRRATGGGGQELGARGSNDDEAPSCSGMSTLGARA